MQSEHCMAAKDSNLKETQIGLNYVLTVYVFIVCLLFSSKSVSL